MECPPFVLTLADIESYFNGRDYDFLVPPPKKAMMREDKIRFVDYAGKVEFKQTEPPQKVKLGRKHIYYVAQYNKDGTLIAKYMSVKAASEKTGIAENSLRKMFCNGSRRSGGYLWTRATSLDKLPEKL